MEETQHKPKRKRRSRKQRKREPFYHNHNDFTECTCKFVNRCAGTLLHSSVQSTLATILPPKAICCRCLRRVYIENDSLFNVRECRYDCCYYISFHNCGSACYDHPDEYKKGCRYCYHHQIYLQTAFRDHQKDLTVTNRDPIPLSEP